MNRPGRLTKRVLLVDDHALFRESLRRLLEADGRYVVVAEFAGSREAVRALEGGLAVDLALIDYQLVGLGEAETGVHLLREMRRVRPGVPVLIVTAGMEHARLAEVVRELRAGVFLKNEPSAELLIAMERTLRGELWVSSGAAVAMLASEPARGRTNTSRRQLTLTAREHRVLRGVLEGSSNKEIGAQMESSESAVKSTIQKLFEKTGVRSRSQLVRVAIEMGLGDESTA